MKKATVITKIIRSKIQTQTSLFLTGLFFLALASFLLNYIIGFYVLGTIFIVLALIINSEKKERRK